MRVWFCWVVALRAVWFGITLLQGNHNFILIAQTAMQWLPLAGEAIRFRVSSLALLLLVLLRDGIMLMRILRLASRIRYLMIA